MRRAALMVLLLGLLGAIGSACTFFARSNSFIAYQLPLSVALRTDSSVDHAVLEYRNACGQAVGLAIDRALRESLEHKLSKVFQKLVVAPSDAPVDGVVDVALGLQQLELFVPRKIDRSYPATVTLGLDFSYSDADGTVRHSKKLQSQSREDVDVTKDSCEVKGLEALGKQAIDTVVEGMAKQLGESAKILEAAKAPKAPRPVAAIPAPAQPMALPHAVQPGLSQADSHPSTSSQPSAGSRPLGDPAPAIRPADPPAALDRKEGRGARLTFRTIFRDENRNQVLEQDERFTVDFEIINEGAAPADNIQIVLDGHSAVLQNLVHPVAVGTLRPGEVKRLTVSGTLGPVSDVEQAELTCILRAAGQVELPPAKKFVMAVRPDKKEQLEVLSVDVDQMPTTPAKLKQTHAVGIAIGVGQFRDPALSAVEFAGRDAEIMAKYFGSYMGIPSARIRLLQNTHALRDDLAEVFEEWLPQHADPRGTVLVYLSGRAIVDAATGAVSVVPFDGRTSAPTRLFSLGRLQRALARAPIQKAVVLLDLSLEPTPDGNATQTPSPAWDIGIDGTETDRFVWVVGNTAVQEAHAYGQGRHGLFTYYLLKGLRGAADLDQNGTVLVSELCRYLPQQVEAAAKQQFGNAQAPMCLPGVDGASPIRAVPLSKLH